MGFQEDRELCPDGACIGLIGKNGRCKECGKRAARTPYRGKRNASNDDEADEIADDEDFDDDGDFDDEDDDGDFDDEDDEDDGDFDDEDEDDDGDFDDEDDDGDFDDEDDGEDDDDDQSDHGRDDSEDRELCPDGNCIGLIGADGKCRECGLPGKSSVRDPRVRNLRSEEEIADELEANIANTDIAAAPESFEDRRLCSDGACIGVIGKNGRCRECGK